jgi:hypothetical protein
MLPKGTGAGAQAIARNQREALTDYADARFGHAATILTGICTAFDADTAELTIREDGIPGTWTASAGGTGVTAAQCVGQRVWCLKDRTSGRVWFRFVIEAP